MPLAQIIAAALSENQAEIAAARIRLGHDLHDVTVSGSPTLLGRMVENVIDNAIRHNHLDGWISVVLADLGDRAQLTVQSSGAALDAARVSELAQPFRRLAADRTGSQNGHGLGLSIVAAIVTAHQGTLELHRAKGGLRVAIELPRQLDGTQVGA